MSEMSDNSAFVKGAISLVMAVMVGVVACRLNGDTLGKSCYDVSAKSAMDSFVFFPFGSIEPDGEFPLFKCFVWFSLAFSLNPFINSSLCKKRSLLWCKLLVCVYFYGGSKTLPPTSISEAPCVCGF